jgi:hypothetical protein
VATRLEKRDANCLALIKPNTLWRPICSPSPPSRTRPVA